MELRKQDCRPVVEGKLQVGLGTIEDNRKLVVVSEEVVHPEAGANH